MGPYELIIKLIQLLQTSAQWRLWTSKYYCEPWATPMLLLVSTCMYYDKNCVLLGLVILMFSSEAQLHKTQILYICFIFVLSNKSRNKTRYCILLRFNFNCNQNPGETKFDMFGQYGPIGLEPPAWRIVHSIRVVLFTNVKMEPPLHRTVLKVNPSFFYTHES